MVQSFLSAHFRSRRREIMKIVVLGLAAFIAVAPTEAAVIELVPAAQSGSLGSRFDVDILVSGLGDGGAPSLGAFDFELGYDSAVLLPTGVTFGSLLGDLTFFEADGGSSAGAGSIDLYEISFLLPAELDLLQPASFVLATLSFEGIGVGTSSLAFSRSILGDAFGEALPVESSGGSIRVVASGTEVPEPPPWLILALGIGFAALAHQRQRQSPAS
jgi:hypothetical protein